MGAAFGLFMSSFEYAGPTMNEEIVKQTTKQQIKHAFKDMGTRSLSMAKNFGMVGMIYSGSECCIESVSFISIGLCRIRVIDLSLLVSCQK